MNAFPLVSIVIPCYNTEQYIEEAVNSALCQTYSNFEVIVVDDGSTDKSYNILCSFGDRIRIVQQKNGGLSAARNAGILAAKGDYIMFVDADDILSPKAVESKMKIMLSDPEIGLVTGNFFILENDDIIPGYIGSDFLKDASDQFLTIFSRGISQLDPLYRKDVFTNCGLFNPYCTVCEDLDHALITAGKYKIGFDDQVHGFYRNLNRETLSVNLIRMYDFISKIIRSRSVISKKKWEYLLHTQSRLIYEARETLGFLKKIPADRRLNSLFTMIKKHPFSSFHFVSAILRWVLGLEKRVQFKKDVQPEKSELEIIYNNSEKRKNLLECS